MGLLYVFPVSLEEEGFAEVKDQTITLKTYGLPYVFWSYAAAIVAVEDIPTGVPTAVTNAVLPVGVTGEDESSSFFLQENRVTIDNKSIRKR